MYISAVKPFSLRKDDAEVVARLARCEGPPTDRPSLVGLMNEDGKVCRLIVCSRSEQARVAATLGELGFVEKNLRGTGYEDIADTLYWKG